MIKLFGIGLIMVGFLLISETNAEYRYRRYLYRDQYRSRSNIFGGMDYQNGTRRIRSIPNIHEGFNYYDNESVVRYKNLQYNYRNNFSNRYGRFN